MSGRKKKRRELPAELDVAALQRAVARLEAHPDEQAAVLALVRRHDDLLSKWTAFSSSLDTFLESILATPARNPDDLPRRSSGGGRKGCGLRDHEGRHAHSKS